MAQISLTHWGRDKMVAFFQTTFSNRFSCMKMLAFRLKFQWSLFPWVQLILFQHWFRYWLGAVQATSHYLNQWWLDYRRIYASLGLNELTAIFHINVIVCPCAKFHLPCFKWVYVAIFITFKPSQNGRQFADNVFGWELFHDWAELHLKFLKIRQYRFGCWLEGPTHYTYMRH